VWFEASAVTAVNSRAISRVIVEQVLTRLIARDDFVADTNSSSSTFLNRPSGLFPIN
jgi:hypothetical protein